MDVFRPELHSVSLHALLNEAEVALGRSAVSKILEDCGLSLERVSDGAAVPFESVEALIATIIERARDPELLSRAMLRVMSPTYIGSLSPLAKPANSDAVVHANGVESACGAVATSSASEGSKRPRESELPAGSAVALIVIADPEQRALASDALAPTFRVRAVTRVADAIELARTLCPDVVIGDAAMLEREGPEICRAFRAADHSKGVPVLILAARDDSEHVRAAFEAGASDCLLVPFDASDLIARAELHVRLRRVTSQLARHERLAALGSLAASVAHNVRNPLSALISGLPAMRKRLSPYLDETTSELMDVMLDCATRIERMTLDLLDLSRIDRHASGEFAPGSGLLACTRMFGARVDGAEVDLVTDVDVLAMTSGRAGDVNHVFMNVLDNALRAIEDKGKVVVRGAVDDGFYVVTIGDSGRGIDSDQLPRVFEPFWTTRAAGEGTGLGLAIARQIVEEHGGTIAAGRSALGGAEFTIRLPLRRAERAA
jgi:signal transduction histidine kinase